MYYKDIIDYELKKRALFPFKSLTNNLSGIIARMVIRDVFKVDKFLFKVSNLNHTYFFYNDNGKIKCEYQSNDNISTTENKLLSFDEIFKYIDSSNSTLKAYEYKYLIVSEYEYIMIFRDYMNVTLNNAWIRINYLKDNKFNMFIGSNKNDHYVAETLEDIIDFIVDVKSGHLE